MRKIQISSARFRSRFYISILQILGIFGMGFLASCVKYGTPEAEYGIPYDSQREIRFSGNVKSEDSLKNIPGIRVRVVNPLWEDSLTVTTGSSGNYVFYYWAWEGDSLDLRFLDPDSTANVGYFRDTTLHLEISGRDFNNSEREVDILLKKK